MKHVILGTMLLVLPTTSAPADTLWQAWQAARANDPAYETASAQLSAAATTRPTALAALLPHFVIAAGAGPQTQYLSQPQLDGLGFEPVTEHEHIGVSTWQVTLNQTLFNWGALKTYQAADSSVQSAAATYQATLESLTVTVVTDYVAVLAAEADLASLRAAAKGFAAQFRDAEALYRAGMAGVIGADEAGAAYQAIQIQVIQAQANLIAARETLATLTGDVGLEPSGNLPQTVALPSLDTMDDWLARAQSGNPTLAAAELMVAADSDLVSAAKGSYLPNISLQLQHNNAAQGGTADFTLPGQNFAGSGNMVQQDNSVTVQMTWNVFDGGATRAAVDQAQAVQDQAVGNAATARLAVVRMVRTDYYALILDNDRLKVANDASNVAAQAVQSATAGVRAGLISESDLIADRQLLLSAQIATHAAVVAIINDVTGLAQAAGSATPSLVQTISSALSTS